MPAQNGDSSKHTGYTSLDEGNQSSRSSSSSGEDVQITVDPVLNTMSAPPASPSFLRNSCSYFWSINSIPRATTATSFGIVFGCFVYYYCYNNLAGLNQHMQKHTSINANQSNILFTTLFSLTGALAGFVTGWVLASLFMRCTIHRDYDQISSTPTP